MDNKRAGWVIPDSGLTIKEAILRSSLPRKEELARLVRPAYYVARDPEDATSRDPGVSRFGGLPDLPPDVAWPKWQDRSLTFVAQINLQELPSMEERALLPERGLLYFFYDQTREAIGNSLEEKESFAVLYAEMNGEVPRGRNAPADLGEKEIITPARISFEEIESEPGWEHPLLQLMGLSTRNPLAYAEVVRMRSREEHQMLGYPTPVQAAVATYCELTWQGCWNTAQDAEALKRIREGALEWELLLQVRSDKTIGMYWPPDAGILYFMIRRADLLARRFDRAWMIKQFS